MYITEYNVSNRLVTISEYYLSNRLITISEYYLSNHLVTIALLTSQTGGPEMSL